MTREQKVQKEQLKIYQRTVLLMISQLKDELKDSTNIEFRAKLLEEQVKRLNNKLELIKIEILTTLEDSN